MRATRAAIFVVVASLLMVVSATVDSFFDHEVETQESGRNVLLVGTTLLSVLSFVPVVVVLVGVGCFNSIKRHRRRFLRVGEKRRFRARVGLLVLVGGLLTLDVGFRTGVAYISSDGSSAGEKWYHSRAAYYCFGFLVEVAIVYLYGLARLSPWFRVGDREIGDDGLERGGTHPKSPAVTGFGCRSPMGNTGGGNGLEGNLDDRGGPVRKGLASVLADRINTEAQVFGDLS